MVFRLMMTSRQQSRSTLVNLQNPAIEAVFKQDTALRDVVGH